MPGNGFNAIHTCTTLTIYAISGSTLERKTTNVILFGAYFISEFHSLKWIGYKVRW